MRPDEWRRGMENEAASVPDQAWARETWWAAQSQQFFPTLASGSACFALLAAAQVLVVQFVFQTEPPASLWVSVIGIVSLVSAALMWRGHLWFGTGLATLVYFPAGWLTVMALQWLMPGQAVFSPGIADNGALILTLLSITVAGMFAHTSHLLHHRRAR